MSDFPEKENIEQENLQSDTVAEPKEEDSTVFSDPAEHKKTAVRQKKKLLPVIIAAVLAVAVLAGGTVAVIKLIPEREESSTPSIETISVLDMNSDDFKSVTVTTENGTFKLYSAEEKKETDSSSSDTSGSDTEINWYLDGYDKEVIDSSSVESIVSSVSKLEAVREVTAKSAAECGLENPAVRADVVKNDGSEFSVLVGIESPDNTGTYVKLSTEEKVYITQSDLKGSFTFDALSLAETSSVPGITMTDDMNDYKGDDGALSSFDTITLTGKNYPEKVVIAPNTDENLSAYATYMTLSPTKRIADNVDGIFNLFKSGVSV